ncbi:acyl-CoA thioesterase-2 [Arenibacter nanhaiticus]|uniref:Acyl-CoA thioesterase 2 n=1 Tax=Arenibacter nanhaiticus TaxID=558155 RepID=A0A1M6GZM5_9FLAO|nr:acyl-CoA thioesterase II [Arenibacter nanhaiticus]SHJ15353.1 acyl-CoA thioesterase-2 [Arenibacter nanhaiticus]
MNQLEDLIDLLSLERINDQTFIGQNYQAPWGRVFGGQVLGQSLHAAYQTVAKDRIAHSMHGYFILGGDLDVPITYEVDNIRDGNSFTTRRVVAKQNGKAIFNMSASFQVAEEGPDHQINMPNVINPELLMTSMEQILEMKNTDPETYEIIKSTHPKIFEFRPTDRLTYKLAKNGPPRNHMWMRTTQSIQASLPLQQQILAYASDYNILMTASLPHREQLSPKKTFYASLDHAIWFHRDFNIDHWLLYAMDSPSASNARGFSRGSIFDKNGVLVASVAQEGLMRQIKG